MAQTFDHALIGDKFNDDNSILGLYKIISSTPPLYDGIYNNEVEIIRANDMQKIIMMEIYSVDVEYAIQSGLRMSKILFCALFNEGGTNIYCGKNTKGDRPYKDFFFFKHKVDENTIELFVATNFLRYENWIPYCAKVKDGEYEDEINDLKNKLKPRQRDE